MTSAKAPNGDRSHTPTTMRNPEALPAPAMCPVKTRRTSSVAFRARLAQRLEFVVGQRDLGGGHVLFEMTHLRRSRDGQHHRRALEQPREGELGRCRVVIRGDSL